MGVYIEGMEMPKENPVLFCVHPDGKVFADLEGEWREYKAVPVPSHGRLIDADKLNEEARLFIKENMLSRDDARELLETIADAPTIIPAEEE